jgi:hypothetical protein
VLKAVFHTEQFSHSCLSAIPGFSSGTLTVTINITPYILKLKIPDYLFLTDMGICGTGTGMPYARASLIVF